MSKYKKINVELSRMLHKFVKTLYKTMQKNSINTAAVKKTLPYGAIKEIAKRSKTSIYTVGRVIKGGSKNALVLKTMKDYLVEMQKINEEINILTKDSSIAC